jgi:hypothetical protein
VWISYVDNPLARPREMQIASLLMQRGLAALDICDHVVDALFGERIEALREKLPVMGNCFLKLSHSLRMPRRSIDRRERDAFGHCLRWRGDAWTAAAGRKVAARWIF